MTYENCIKYRDEAKTDEEREFWDERVKRKYPEKFVEKPKPKKTKSKEKK